MRYRILEKWNTFSALVLPAEVGEIQRTEMRRAFFAGAASCFDIVSSIDKQTSEDAGCALLDEIHRELEEHCQRMLRGAA
jgi:hypothetical protein